MKIFYRLFRQDPESREGIIATTSGLGVIVNLLIALLKIVVGAIASSVAIISEGANNAADAVTSILALLGAKLAKKHPDEKHPFGYGRIEYLASLVIAALILVTGVEMLIESVKLIFEPAELEISYLSLAVVFVTAICKFFFGLYTIKMGKKADSSALIGVGTEGRNDSFASGITIVSSLLFLLFGISVDAYAGILISLLIVKAGADLLWETVSDLLGRAGEKELADKLYREIRATDGVLGAADMMLHNYGPDAWSGSVNLEIDHNKTVEEIYRFLHALQLRIMHEYHVTMVFGVYAVDRDAPEMKELRHTIGSFVKEEENVRTFHALYLDENEKKLYVDFIVDYALRDWDAVREKFLTYMKEKTPEYTIELTLETEFV